VVGYDFEAVPHDGLMAAIEERIEAPLPLGWTGITPPSGTTRSFGFCWASAFDFLRPTDASRVGTQQGVAPLC